MDELNSQGEVNRDNSYENINQGGYTDTNYYQNNTNNGGINQQNMNGAYNPYYQQSPDGMQNPYNHQHMNTQYNMSNPYYSNNQHEYNRKSGGGEGQAIASLILGILSLVFSWVFPGLVLLMCIVGILLAIISLATRKAGKGMAISGLVMGIVGLLWAALILSMFRY